MLIFRLQVCRICLGVGKGVNIIIKRGSLLVDSEVFTCQFVFCFRFMGNHVTRMCALYCHLLSSTSQAGFTSQAVRHIFVLC